MELLTGLLNKERKIETSLCQEQNFINKTRSFEEIPTVSKF